MDTAPKPSSKPQKPAGWWSLPDLSGSLAGVSAAVDANPDIPDHWKAAIKAELAARISKPFNFVYLDAHCMIQAADAKDCPGKLVLHIDITPDAKLL